MWEKKIFFIAVIYRLINCLLVQTSFVPDEYWQSLEPAYQLVFGYGRLSWEWNHGLRSYLYSLLFASEYKLLSVLHLDFRSLIVYVPRITQSLFAAVADIYLYKLTNRLYGETAALWTLICYWLNWFAFFCAPRTLANTIETELTVIALYYYPWPNSYLYPTRERRRDHSRIYLCLVTVATIIRPTSAVLWLPLCLWHLRRERSLTFIVKTVLPASLPVFLLSVLIDRLCYGYFVLSLWRFLQFNVLQGGSALFGVHPWHWYVTNGLPTVLLTHVMVIVAGIYKIRDPTMLFLSAFYIGIHSALSHKELRFLLPVLPLLCTYAGRYIDNAVLMDNRRNTRRVREVDEDDWVETDTSSIRYYLNHVPKRAKALAILLFVTNLPLMLYTGMFHQRGVLDVPKFLHEEATIRPGSDVWFLTPCYTSPFYSHVHAKVSLRMLDCEPNLSAGSDYLDEADRFHLDPQSWILREFNGTRSGHRSVLHPTHVVMFDWLWTKLGRRTLEPFGYRRCGKFYNTDFPTGSRQSQYLIVACNQLSVR